MTLKRLDGPARHHTDVCDRPTLSKPDSDLAHTATHVIKRVPGLVEMALARIVQEAPAEFKYKPRFVSEHGIDLEAPHLAGR